MRISDWSSDVCSSDLETFPTDFQAALVETVLGRLGVKPKCDGRDTDLLVALETALAKKTVEIDRFFFDWRGGRRRGPSPADPHYEAEEFANLCRLIEDYEPAVSLDHPYWSDEAHCSMHIDEVEVIRSEERRVGKKGVGKVR